MLKDFKVGALILPPVQLLDIAPVDIFHMCSKQYLAECQLPAPLVNQGIDLTITYIAPAGNTAEFTASAGLRITADLKTSSVAPGELDVLFIPGPDPNAVPNEEAKEFIKAHAAQKRTTVIVICTGIFPAGYSGILDGKTVTCPRALTPRIKKLFPAANIIDKRWTRDVNVWTSGGITNGNDLVAGFIRDRFPSSVAETVCSMAEVGDRGSEYYFSKASMYSGFGWQILKAWVLSFRGK